MGGKGTFYQLTVIFISSAKVFNIDCVKVLGQSKKKLYKKSSEKTVDACWSHSRVVEAHKLLLLLVAL